MLFAIPESISGVFFGLIPFKATGSHLSEIQCTVTIKIPQDALLVKLIYLIFLISFAYYLFIFVKILDAPTRFCYTGSSYKEDLSKMMDINYELYKVFYYVAISLSFSDASKQLFISQSAVSQSVKVLEKKLGITLFIRSTKRVQLTPEGETLLRHIEPAMNLIKRGEAQIMEASNLGGGQLRIGASDTICRYYLVPFLNKFHKTYPNVHIKVTNQTSTKCVDLLEMGQVDLIVTNYPNSRLSHGDHIRTIHSFRDCFIASSTHYKELMDKKLHLKDLLDYPIMMLDRKSTTSEFLHHLFQQHQLDLVPEIELSSNDLLIDLARIGLGIAFVPDFCIPKDEKQLFILKLSETLPIRQLVVVHNENLPVSQAAKQFMDML